MHTKTSTKIIRYILPSLSEFEFTFISSLLTCTALASVILHLDSIGHYISVNGALSWLLIIGCTFVPAIFLGSMIMMSITAYKRPFALNDIRERMRYILLPATILMFIGITDFLFHGFTNGDNFNSVSLTGIILLARYTVVSILGSLVNYSGAIQQSLATIMDDYQMDFKASTFAVALGVVGAVGIIFTRDWLFGLLILSSLGLVIIRVYRDIMTPEVA